MAERRESGEEVVLKVAAGIGVLAAGLFYWPVSLGLAAGAGLLSRWPLPLLALPSALYAGKLLQDRGYALTVEGVTDYGVSWSLAQLDAVPDLLSTARAGELSTLANPGALASGMTSAPLFLSALAVGAILGHLGRLRRRRKIAAAKQDRQASSGASSPHPEDRPASTSNTPSARSPLGSKAAAVWTVDGGLPPGLGASATAWASSQGFRGRLRYTVAQSVIFGWVGPPRYRVLHGKGGVGGLFTRFRAAALHGNVGPSGSDTRYWDAGLPGSTHSTRYRIVHRVATIYRVVARRQFTVYPPLYSLPIPAAGTRFRGDVWSTYTETPENARIRHDSGLYAVADQTDVGVQNRVDGDVHGNRAHSDQGSNGETSPRIGAPPPGERRTAGAWGDTGRLGSVETWMAPPKSGKSTVLKSQVRAILTGDEFLGWQTGRSGVVWLSEEDAETFAFKRRAILAAPAIVSTDQDGGATTAPASTRMGEDAPGAPEIDPALAARFAVVYGPNLPTGLPHLVALLAEAIAMCRLRESATGEPWRVVIIDSLFFWAPECETDVQAAGRVMAALKSAAALGYRLVLVTHADPESGKQKGPQQLWRQTDYRVALTAEPAGPIEDTTGRRLTFTGRYPDGQTPPPLTFAMVGSDLAPWSPPEPGERHAPKRPDSSRRAAAGSPGAQVTEVPQVQRARPVDRFLAALPLDGSTVDLASVTVPGMARSRVYDLAKEAEDTGRALRITIGRRGKLGIRRVAPIAPESRQHESADSAPE